MQYVGRSKHFMNPRITKTNIFLELDSQPKPLRSVFVHISTAFSHPHIWIYSTVSNGNTLTLLRGEACTRPRQRPSQCCERVHDGICTVHITCVTFSALSLSYIFRVHESTRVCSVWVTKCRHNTGSAKVGADVCAPGCFFVTAQTCPQRTDIMATRPSSLQLSVSTTEYNQGFRHLMVPTELLI